MSGGQILHDPFARALTSTKAGAPAETDDETLGFAPGHVLIDTVGGAVYVCRDATATSAIWANVSAVAGAPAASAVTYDNTASGLVASNVQAAIDEVDGNVDAVVSDLADVVAGTTDIAFVSTGSLASTTLEAAINEAADAANVFVDTSASALTSNRVEAAINELANDSGLVAYDNTVSGLVAADVQAAIDELARARVISAPAAAATVNVTAADRDIIIIDTASQAVTVNLPRISTLGGVARRFVIKDSGNAAANNITVVPDASGSPDTIDGMADAVIRTSYSALTVVAHSKASADEWLVI